MSAAQSARPFEEDDDEHEAELAFLDSLPGSLRGVSARRALTREDLPRRGGSMDDPRLSAATQRIWDAEKEMARCLAEKHRALADLYELDGDYEEITEVDSVDTARAALALRVTASAAGWQLRDAHQAVHLFPRCLEALESGALPSTWFEKMLRTSRSLRDRSRRELDIAVSGWSPDISAERFFALLKKLIALLQQREDRPDPLARLTCGVELLPTAEAGMGTIRVSGPIPEILAQWKQLDESARAVQTAQRTALREGTEIPHDPDGRVLETGRALPLAELRFALMASAALDLDGVTVPAGRFRLNVMVPALTLLGASDEPGCLDGIIPLPPSMARALAGTCGTWYRVLTHPTRDAFLPLPANSYQPTTAMLEHLRLRNSLCAVPGCTRPTSWASECDHIEECRRGTPGEGGLTEIENLHLLCWQHHLDKSNGLLDPTRLPTGPTEPGRTRWAVGRHGDVVTVIDDLDTASRRTAEELEHAWSAFLRGTRAADPATDPLPADPLPAEPRPPGADSTGREPPGRADPPRLIRFPRSAGDEQEPPPPQAADADGEPPSSPVLREPPIRRSEHRRPPAGTEIPPDPGDDLGPPPF